MAIRTETREVGTLHLRAAFQPDTVNREKRTVDLTWTTGARVMRGYYDRFWEELSLDPKHVRMDRLNNGAPFLMDHAGYRVVETPGVVVNGSAKLLKTEGRATVRFIRAGVDPEADKLFEKIADGIVQNVSVGYRVHKMEKVEDGEDKIPVYRATDWEPHEISSVAMGADDGAGFRSAKDVQSNPCVFVTRQGADVEKTEQEKQADALAAAEAKRALEAQAALKAEAQNAEIEKVAAQRERERTEGIRTAGKVARIPEEKIKEAIAKGTALDAFRALALTALAAESDANPTRNNVRVEIGDTDHQKFARHATAALFARLLDNPVQEAVAKKVRGFENVELDPGEYRGLSLMGLARECLERSGVNTRRMLPGEIVRRAFTMRDAGYAGTTDFPVLLENAMGKILLGAYATTPDTWTRFCKTDTVPDFRDSPRYRTGTFGALDSLDENGEFKNKSIPDGQKTVLNVATKGNIIAITRQLIINDDMSALADLATKLGRAAKLSIELDVYTLLTANAGLGSNVTVGGVTQNLFHAAWGNINTVGSAIGIAGLDADRVKMAIQKDISANEYLDLKPAVLVLPVSLGGDARVFNDAQYDTTDNKFAMPNKVRGLFRDIVDTPRLTGTRRYLFADPSVAAAIVVVFLEGQGQGPMLDTEAGWRVDGTEMKVRMDYKVQPFDPKGAITNAGV